MQLAFDIERKTLGLAGWDGKYVKFIILHLTMHVEAMIMTVELHKEDKSLELTMDELEQRF